MVEMCLQSSNIFTERESTDSVEDAFKQKERREIQDDWRSPVIRSAARLSLSNIRLDWTPLVSIAGPR